MEAEKRESQRKVLASIVEQAREAEIKIRWCRDDILVLGLPEESQETEEAAD